MLLSKYHIPTLKETPGDAEIISHKYMIRAGMLRKISSGIYSYLPLCCRVIKKIENIVREEMDKAGAQEIIMPILTPSNLWIESGRWGVYGKELMRFKDRHNKEYALGPTHEEVVTALVRNEINSYKQLPVCLYQINTKFRDEMRPRFGVMRAREFIMKDGYSFHDTEKSLDDYYKLMYKVYTNIFKRCGLNFRAVLADSGAIGGDDTHEFMVLANSGESKVISCSNSECGYAATDETAESKISIPKKEDILELKEVDTPNKKTIEEVSKFFKVEKYKLVKTILYKVEDKFYAILIRGDKTINDIKLKKILNVPELFLAEPQDVQEITNAEVGFAGPINLNQKVEILADKSIQNLTNFIVGANKTDKHFINVNIERDLKIDKYIDVKNADAGDKCINCGSELKEYRGIEVGQIFKLGKKYSESMQALYNDENGKLKPFIMGCYGIGITRIIAASIEQNYDDDGIIWPVSIAPFKVCIILIGKEGSDEYKVAEKIYNELKTQNIEVIFDERKLRPGFKFKDADLIGYPLQVIIGKKTLQENKVEIKIRKTKEKLNVELNEIINFIENKLKQI